MCLNTLGDDKGGNLCGFYGTCVENVCVCDAGWSNSIEQYPTLFLFDGAKRIFEEEGNSTISFEEFKIELLKRVPCSRNDVIMYIVMGLAFICCFQALWKQLPFAISGKRRFLLMFPQILTFCLGIITAILKFISLETNYPYNLFYGLSYGVIIICMSISQRVFFFKYIKYHSKKAKELFEINSYICGISLERILTFHQKYFLISDLIILFFIWISPVLIIFSFKFTEELNFNLLKSSQYILSCHFYYGAIYLLWLCVLTRLVFSELVKDCVEVLRLKKQSINKTATSDSSIKKLHQFMNDLNSIGSSIFWFSLLWFILFFLWGVLQQSQVSVQYLNPTATGIMWPLLTNFTSNAVRKSKQREKEARMKPDSGESLNRLSV
eukprot:maker-scaffold_1-snap-gene-8.0-mRNA-1 protein AED:0.00 eAED:0.00 QI:97/1/1/1/1/1/2/234/380